MDEHEALSFIQKSDVLRVTNIKAKEAVGIAISALEKQIPYKVKITGHNNAIGYEVGECACGEMVRSIFTYCFNCGRKLGW